MSITPDKHPNPLTLEQLQASLFPTRTSVADVIAEGIAQLPITTENQLRALLQTYHNTLTAVVRKSP